MSHFQKVQPRGFDAAGFSVAPFAAGTDVLVATARCGVNLAGAEFGCDMPGVYGQTYIYPPASVLDYHRSQGRTLFRLPFRWERIQHAMFAPLDSEEVERLREVLQLAHEREMQVILDVHNYGRYVFPGDDKYEGSIIGSEKVPYAAFADLWSRLVTEFKDEPAVYAYGLMNEPHDMGDPERWPRAAQAAIEAIRTLDPETTIMVPGDDWTAARHWPYGKNANLNAQLFDPSDNLVFEAHCYFDKDNSGTYKLSYEEEEGSPVGGVEYVRPFVKWCQEKGVLGFIGEYGIPDTDARWLETMEQFLDYLCEQNMGSAYWAGGPWWNDDAMAIEAREEEGVLVDRPQMEVLRRYAG